MAKKWTYQAIFKILLSCIIFFTFMAAGSLKSGYHVDEMLTFQLANHPFQDKIDIQDGAVYTGQQLWQEHIVADAAHTFDYRNVFENQIHDTHPPLYYCLIHTICSFFPNSFGLWMGLIVNAGLAVIVFHEMLWLFRYFLEDTKIAVIFSLLFLFTMAFVNSVVFFRMYVLLSVWTLALTILFYHYEPWENNWKYYIFLTLIMTSGIMTHYYFIIYAFFLCAVYAIRVISRKNWKKLILSSISICASFAASSCIFPRMWYHILFGGRGSEAFRNLGDKKWIGSLWNYLGIINLQLFGNLFLFLFIFILLLYIVQSGLNQYKNIYAKVPQFIQLLVPVIFYIALIAKIAPYDTDRYIMNIMGILYLLVFASAAQLAKRFSNRATVGIIILAALTLFCSYRNGIPYLNTTEQSNIDSIRQSGTDALCLYLYDYQWQILPNYTELAELEQIIFIKSDNKDTLNQLNLQDYPKLLIYIPNAQDSDGILQQILEQNPQLNTSEKLFSNGYESAYYLE